MKKTKLQVDALRVESFATGQLNAVRGTVRGNEGFVSTIIDPSDRSVIDSCMFNTCNGCR